jgi:hypothetical protein
MDDMIGAECAEWWEVSLGEYTGLDSIAWMYETFEHGKDLRVQDTKNTWDDKKHFMLVDLASEDYFDYWY